MLQTSAEPVLMK